jgi:hypothetical protein
MTVSTVELKDIISFDNKPDNFDEDLKNSPMMIESRIKSEV